MWRATRPAPVTAIPIQPAWIIRSSGAVGTAAQSDANQRDRRHSGSNGGGPECAQNAYMRLSTMCCLGTVSLMALACSSPDDGPEVASDESEVRGGSRECAGAKSELDGIVNFEDDDAALAESANTMSLHALGLAIDQDGVDALVKARTKAPFDSATQVACVSGIGADALGWLMGESVRQCGLGDARAAKADTTPRLCGPWAEPCGNKAGQRACDSPRPKGTFVRDADKSAALAALPQEIAFDAAKYTAKFPDGRAEKGEAWQVEKRRERGAPFVYMRLFPKDRGRRAFQMKLSADGSTLQLEPLKGSVGREVPAPKFHRSAP